MNQIFKTPKKATYLEGTFQLRDESKNRAHPIDSPTVFEAYGAAIKSGNWQSCTAINTPQYVIDNYFNKSSKMLKSIWDACFSLENITWEDVRDNKEMVLSLINKANNELLKLPQLK